VALTMYGQRIAFMVAPKGIKRTEFTGPWRAIQEAGGTPVLLAEDREVLRVFDEENNQHAMFIEKVLMDADADDYDGAVLTAGGVDSTLHMIPQAVQLVSRFVASGKPVAAASESLRTLINADVVRGRRVSCASTLETHLREAGAECVDMDVVADDGLVTSRNLDQIPAFCQQIVERFGRVAPLAVGRQ
jgi:protease I